MKRPLRLKEAAFILLPVLGLGAFAWFQRRVETVKTPQPTPASNVAAYGIAIRPTNKQLRATGLSHEITVKIRYSGVRPSNWGIWNKVVPLDPLQAVSRQTIPAGFKPRENLSYGAVLTTKSTQKGKPVIKTQWRDKSVGLGGITMLNNELVVSHQISLKKIPASAGEVTFQGLYLVPGGEPVKVKCVVRPAVIYPLPSRTTKPTQSAKKPASSRHSNR